MEKILKELLTPSFRKLSYLYANLCDKDKNRFVMGRKPELLEAGRTSAGLGVIEFKDTESYLSLYNFIKELILKDGKEVEFCIVHLATLSTLLSKKKKKEEFVLPDTVYNYDEETFDRRIPTNSRKPCVLYETIKPFFWKKTLEYVEEINHQLDHPQFHICETIENVSQNLKVASGNKLKVSVLKGIEELKAGKKETLIPVLWKKTGSQCVYYCGGYMENEKFRFLSYRPSLWYVGED